MRKLLRLLLVTIAGGLILAIVFGVVGEFFIELAREKGWYDKPSQRLDAVMDALTSFVTQSWFLAITTGIAGLALGMWIDAALRRREVRQPLHMPIQNECVEPLIRTDGEETEHISEEYVKLSRFFVEYLLPLSESLLSLQKNIISSASVGARLRELAQQSLTSAAFFSSLTIVTNKLSSSPAEHPTLYDLSVAIHNAEFSYRDCLNDTNALADSVGVSLQSDRAIAPLWEEWRSKHNALVAAYRDIKLDPTLGRLYRPIRRSKWGDIIPPYSSRTT